jgi:hypothetical protein
MDPETNCQWKAYGNFDKINKKWRLTKLPPLSNHCHDLLSDAKITKFIFPSARKLDDDTKQDVLSMLRHAQPNTVKSIVTRKGNVVKDHDIYNLKQRDLRPHLNGKAKDERFPAQIKFMQDNGFIIQVKKDENNVVRMLLITNKNAIEMTRQYGEVLSADSTYKTNDLQLPVLNIVGFTNLGSTVLKTFVAATIVMFSEVKTNYEWAFQTFRDIVWENESVNTKVNYILYKKKKKN